MRGMRNRIAHGYFEINLDVVWETIKSALPQLMIALPIILETPSTGDGTVRIAANDLPDLKK